MIGQPGPGPRHRGPGPVWSLAELCKRHNAEAEAVDPRERAHHNVEVEPRSNLGGRRGHTMGVDDLLREAIEKICGIPASSVTDSTPLVDLDIDSLAIAEIIVELEIRLDTEFPIHLLRELDRVRTVGDVARELAAALPGGDLNS